MANAHTSPAFVGRDSRIELLPAPHGAVGFTVEAHDDCDTIEINFYGTREAMVAAGAAPAFVLARKKGKALVDELGDCIHFTRHKGWEIMRRWKDAETALALPGVTKRHVDRALAKARADRAARPDTPPVEAIDPMSREMSSAFARGLATGSILNLIKTAWSIKADVEKDAREYRLLVEFLHLVDTRKGAAAALERCLDKRQFLDSTVTVLRQLPTWELKPNPRGHLRLVVDNTPTEVANG